VDRVSTERMCADMEKARYSGLIKSKFLRKYFVNAEIMHVRDLQFFCGVSLNKQTTT